MKPRLTIEALVNEASEFCSLMSGENHRILIGVTDGKAVGTYVEHRFQKYLYERYQVEIGSSAKGIDLPSDDIMTDIKVTSITQPQSSCPFRSARQKIFGLGYCSPNKYLNYPRTINRPILRHSTLKYPVFL